MPMDERIVRRLEKELEEAIGEAFGRTGSRKPAIRPTGHTIHMMAKAAVAVYEAVIEDSVPQERDD